MASNLALLALTISLLLAAPPAYSERRGFRATMTRTEPAINFTRAARKSQERLSMLAARLDAAAAGPVSAQTPLQMDAGRSEYDMALAIGTPPQNLSALADTGSDLIWAKCGECKHCTPKGSPSFFPNRSSSFSRLPCSSPLCGDVGGKCVAAGAGTGGADQCDYTYYYGLTTDSHHYTQGFLGSESFTLGGDVARGVGFGCTNRSEGYYGSSSGLVGLGRGPLSLVSQLNAGAFSYCLSPNATKRSPLLFGSLAVLSATAAGGIQTTPLLANSTYYSVDLQRISIGAVTAPGPGTAGYGTLFDSGTTLTFLAEPAYTRAKTALLNQTTLRRAPDRDGYEACFHVSSGRGASGRVPEMTLHFDGADMALPLPNCFVRVGHGVICWIVQRSPSLSIVGNIMQRNFHIRYDVEKAALSFQPANCDSL